MSNEFTQYGLTAQGFIKKRLEDIKQDMDNQIASQFGNQIDTSTYKVLSVIVGLVSSVAADIWDLDEGVYHSQYLNSANDVSLDNVVVLLGIERNGATKTTVTAALKGVEGTAVGKGKQAKIQNTQNVFTLDADTTITIKKSVKLVLDIQTVVDNTDYFIIINTVETLINSGAGATKKIIADKLVAQIQTLALPVEISDDAQGILTITTNDYNVTFSGDIDEKISIVELWSKANFTAADTGEIIALANTLNQIQSPIDGWSGVNNFIDGVVGRVKESDTSERLRARLAPRELGNATVEAIRAKLINEVSGVTFADVIVNNDDVTDSGGRPPHSYECVVQGGTDLDVAYEIWKVGGAGIETYGNTQVIITDSMGRLQAINFSRPSPVYVWIRITLTLINGGQFFPDGGMDAIKSEVLKYAIGNDEEGYIGFGVGSLVIFEEFYIPIFKTPGIASAIIELGTSENPNDEPTNWASANVDVSERQIPLFDSSRIVVST